MKPTNVQKTTKNILTIALIMQIVYLLNIALFTMMPRLILPFWGHSGNYDLPFDVLHFGGTVISTAVAMPKYGFLRQSYYCW